MLRVRRRGSHGLGSDGVQNDSNEENSHTHEDVERVSLLSLHEEDDHNAQEHRGSKEKRNGTGQAVTINQHKHDQRETHGRRSSEEWATNLVQSILPLMVIPNSEPLRPGGRRP